MVFDYSNPASLMPCLHPAGGGIGLKIRLISELPADLENSPDPFLVVSDAISYTRLVAANFQTDTGQPVREIFLLQQSDEYPRSAGDLWPLKNPDIEARWQSALRRHLSQLTGGGAGAAPFLLQGQIGPGGALAAFHPLFYCKLKARYFHPPCPACGRPLHLCRDDAPLANAGLGGYADTLERYLYCPECCAGSSDPRFYAPRREPGQSSRVADLQALILGFGNLAVMNPAGQLDGQPNGRMDMPCTGCPECSACYGKSDLALKRLAPFGFYPFFAFLYEAGTCHGVDFLSLLGGAPPDVLAGQARQGRRPGRLRALQSARQKDPAGLRRLFSRPEQADQRFLEILYLKLCFLAQLADNLMSGIHSWDDPGAFSLERVWVSVPESGGYLPSGWNFTVRHYGLGLDAGEGSGLTDPPPVSRMYFLGQVWFLALLVNSHQEMAEVRPALDKLIRGWCSGVSEFRNARFQELDPVFNPGNISFAPVEWRLSASVQAHWERALKLGADLLVACLDPRASGSPDDFRVNLEKLRSDIQGDLFRFETPAAPPDAAEVQLSGILTGLITKWRSEADAAAAAMAGPVVKEPAGATRLDKRLRLESSQDLEETLVLKPARGPGQAEPPAAAQPAGAGSDELLEETVVVKPRTATTPRAAPAAADLPETLILSARRSARPGGPPAAKGPAVPDVPADSPATKPTRAAEPDLEDLAETVIIRPEKEGK